MFSVGRVKKATQVAFFVRRLNLFDSGDLDLFR